METIDNIIQDWKNRVIDFNLFKKKLSTHLDIIRTALLHTVERFVIPFLCPDILEHVGWGDALYNFMPKHKKK